MAKSKNGQKTNNDLQNITYKTKDQVTRTPLKTNNDLQNITHKTKDQVTRTPLKTNNDLQNITYKTKDRVTRTPLKTVIDTNVFGLYDYNLFLFILLAFRAQSGLEPTIYHNRGEHANHYITDAVC
jgi:hypothetical protein